MEGIIIFLLFILIVGFLFQIKKAPGLKYLFKPNIKDIINKLPKHWDKITLRNYLEYYKIKSPSKTDVIKYIGNISEEIIEKQPEWINDIYLSLYWATKTKPEAEVIKKYQSFSWYYRQGDEGTLFTIRDIEREYIGNENGIEYYRDKLEKKELDNIVYIIARLLKRASVYDKREILFNFEGVEARIEIAYEMPITKALYIYKYFMGYDFYENNGNLNIAKNERRIPQNVKDSVWRRAEGKCELCGSRVKLEFDHIVPYSKGGANTYRNIQLLCEKCNREKYNKIG